MDREEYISDEGNYSSISSTSGFSTFEDDTDCRGGQIGSTDVEKQLLLQIDKSAANLNRVQHDVLLGEQLYKTRLHSKNIWSKHHLTSNINESLAEKINQELGLENAALQTENKEWRFKFDAQQKEINRLNGDKECRESCILQLKSKIAEQQENIHDLTQQNFKCNIELSTVQNELTTTKGTVDWYKNEWTISNNDRNSLQKDLFLSKNSLRNKKLEITRLEALLSDLRLQIFQNTKSLKDNLLETKTTEASLPEDEISSRNETKCDCETTTKYYLSEIEDLNNEILAVKMSFAQQTEVISKLVKENSEFAQKSAVLQKEIDNKEVFNLLHVKQQENLQRANIDLVKMNTEKEQCLLELKTKLKNLNIQLDSSTKEKLLIQESINATRNSFHKLVALQDELKDEMKQKSKMVFTLEKKIQDSFMYENWNKCAIEKFAMKEENYIQKVRDLGQEIEYLKSEIVVKSQDSQKLRLEVDEIKKYCKSVMAENADLNVKVGLAEKLNSELVEKENMFSNVRLEEFRQLCSKLGVEYAVDIEEIVHNVQNVIQTMCQQQNQAQYIDSCADSEVNLREQLELRCVAMAKKCSTSEILIVRLKEEILKLRDAIHLNEVALCDKQKRYEMYYRALLKKVKQYKQEAKRTHQENIELRNQRQNMFEELNTRKLELFQYQLDKDSDANLISKKTEFVHNLQDVLHNVEEQLKKKCVIVATLEEKCNELSSKYEKLVSTHSNCLSTIETTGERKQGKLDMDKIADCTILNTQHALIEKLQTEKSNALRLIGTFEGLHREHQSQMQELRMEKTFMQRLIIDMKAALNASAAKQKFKMGKPLVVPLDLSKYTCSPLRNETELLRLCEKTTTRQKPQGNLQENVQSLKTEMANLKIQLSDVQIMS